jgi:hypothetical protein
LGWLLSQVTVCPVVGFSVGVQAARAGAAGQQSAAAASAKAEALERRRARKSSGALTICRGANRSDKDADRIIDVSPAQGYASGEAGNSRRRVAVPPLNLPLRR